MTKLAIPLGKRIITKTSQKTCILHSILKEELSDSDSEALIEEIWADEVLLLK